MINQSELLISIIKEIFPEGFPSNEQINNMNIEEKQNLFLKQKLIISNFRKKADEKINELELIIKNKKLFNNNIEEINIENKKIDKEKSFTNPSFAPCLRYKNPLFKK